MMIKDKNKPNDNSKSQAKQYEEFHKITYEKCESDTYEVIKSNTRVLQGKDDGMF